MWKLTIYFTSLLVTVLASGDLIILNHPKSISFKGHERIDQSLLPEMYSAAMGFTVEQDSSWSGMYLVDPFHLAEAIVTVMIDGVSDIGSEIGHHYPLHTNDDETFAWHTLEKRVTERFPNGKSQLVRVELNDGLEKVKDFDILKQVKIKPVDNFSFLKRTTEEDLTFLNELAVLNAIVDEIEAGTVKQNYSPDVFWFVLTGLHPVSDLHGYNSSATAEAKQALVETLVRLTEAFKKAYNGNVLVTAVTTDASHTRFARDTKEASETENNKESISDKLNLAQVYSEDYPVIFNIMLWFGVAMFFSLLAICVTIASMDPGRDSIIYRMTSNRMKKDN